MYTETKPSSDEYTVLALRNYFHQLQSAQCEFEELWHATGQGEQLPDKEATRQLLRTIVGRAELMELALTSLRILRDFPEITKPRGERKH